MGLKITDDVRFDQLLKEATRDSLILVPNTELLSGRFVIKRRLGSGGMGVVYEALDKQQSIKVAIKVLSEVNASGIYHLKQEFRLLADVVHPNLVVLHELFWDKGQWFFTMELVVGYNLIEGLNRKRDAKRMRRIFRQLANGIHAIHDAGKLHRDLKPNNVLLTLDDQVKILDFGLASDQEVGGVGQTLIEAGISGTPTYMAPEQAAEEPATKASDWYAFGVMMFEALTGIVPFDGDSKQMLERKQIEEAPVPSNVRSDLPDDLNNLCSNLLQRNPEKRPRYAEIVKRLGTVSTPVPPPSQQEEMPFVGRGKEMARLENAFKATDKGRPVVAFVHGISGIGKTTLIERFIQRVKQQSNPVVLKGRCYERETVPYKACDSLVDELTRYLRLLPENRAARLMPRQIPALAQIFPVLERLDVVRETKHRHPLPNDPNELRRIAFLAAKELLAHITLQDPLIVYVDDMQWSDVDGIKLLTSLIAEPDPPSLLLIFSFRSEDENSSPGLTALQERIREMESVDLREVMLSKLGMVESCSLAGELLSDETRCFASQIAEESQGNPFFISEIARYAATKEVVETKPSLERAIEHRLAGLDSLARVLIELVSISPGPLKEQILQAALNNTDIGGALKALELGRLIRQTGGTANRIACYHDRIRVSVAATLGEDGIKKCHQQLADALELAKDPDPVALTEHLLGAKAYEKAGKYAIQAAKSAEKSLAFENAARLYKIAIDYNRGDGDSRRQMLTSLGEALSHAGRGADAAREFMNAAKGASAEEALELRRRAAQQWINSGHLDEGVGALGDVLKDVGLKLYPSEQRSLIVLLKNRLSIKLTGLDFVKREPDAVEQRSLVELRTCEAITRGLWLVRPIQSAVFCSRYLRLALRLGIVRDVAVAASAESAYRALEGVKNREASQAFLNMSEKLSTRLDDPETLAFLHLGWGMHHFFLTELPESEPHLREALRLSYETSSRKTSTLEIAQSLLGSVYTYTGNWRTLQQEWDLWVKSAKERGNLYQLAMCRIWSMGFYRQIIDDDVDQAEAQLTKTLDEWSWARTDVLHGLGLESKIYIELYRGHFEEAHRTAKLFSDTVRHSILRRMQLIRVFSDIALARALLSLASHKKGDRSLLKSALGVAAKLGRERCAMARPFVPFIKGSVACLEGKVDLGESLLGEALVCFKQAQYKMKAAAVQHQLGQLIGGDEGEKLIRQSERDMRKEGVKNPEKVASLLAPGGQNR